VARRSFLTRFGAGVTAFGTAFTAGAATASAQTGSIGSDWAPSRHAEDDWMDELPGGHRFILDNTTATGFAGSMQYAANFFNVNRDDYGLSDSDLAVIIVARHFSTPFAFNDAMWEKYGETWSQLSGYTDPETSEPPTINVYHSRGAGRGGTLAALFDRGMKVALCSVATRAFTGAAAQGTGANPDGVFDEVMDNLLDGVVPVPAGIVAINRAQERGYTFSFTA
jgi:hypothetical protein